MLFYSSLYVKYPVFPKISEIIIIKYFNKIFQFELHLLYWIFS